MNTGFYKDLDTNFQLACEMSEKTFSHEELIALLETGNIPEKQIAAIKLENLHSEKEANILLNNLTGCDGKIREAVAVKINKLLAETPTYANYFNYPEIFANATIDINGNICRVVIDSVAILKNNKDFNSIYLNKIIVFINEAFESLDNFIFRDKKYVINKQLFKLYWSLEALKLFTNDIDKNTLLKILSRAREEKEYTIREKVAQILNLVTDKDFNQLKISLKNDENYYVKNAIKI